MRWNERIPNENDENKPTYTQRYKHTCLSTTEGNKSKYV